MENLIGVIVLVVAGALLLLGNFLSLDFNCFNYFRVLPPPPRRASSPLLRSFSSQMTTSESKGIHVTHDMKTIEKCGVL